MRKIAVSLIAVFLFTVLFVNGCGSSLKEMRKDSVNLSVDTFSYSGKTANKEKLARKIINSVLKPSQAKQNADQKGKFKELSKTKKMKFRNGDVAVFTDTNLSYLTNYEKNVCSYSDVSIDGGYAGMFWSGTEPQYNCDSCELDITLNWIGDKVSIYTKNAEGDLIELPGNKISFKVSSRNSWFTGCKFGPIYEKGPVRDFNETVGGHAYFASIHTVISPYSEFYLSDSK